MAASVVYLNISFDFKKGGTHQVEYEPVLVSKEINSNIFGVKTENKFKSCQRDFEKLLIEYKTDKNQTVFVKCYKYLKCYSDLSHLPNWFDKEKLKTILIDYYDKIRDKNVSESTIPYKHAIELYDDTAVTSKPRIVPYAYRS